MMSHQEKEGKKWEMRALTPIWTGDIERKNGRLILTGLIGSLRWWFEVLVRGLGGKACDPTVNEHRCPDRKVKDARLPRHHCVVCELFGCTGWARKFRLMVLDGNGTVLQNQIEEGDTFLLRFIPLRPIREEEWCLLDLTLRLIADYGAIGGKTVYKPTEEEARQSAQHHQDFGLVKLVSSMPGRQFQENELRRYVSLPEWRELQQEDFAWASLQHFWCVPGKYLSRENAHCSSFNRVLGRNEGKNYMDCGQVHNPPAKRNKHPRRQSDHNPTGNLEKWLAGGRGESKKVFSFKHPQEATRTFGFVKPGLIDFNTMKQRLTEAWKENDWDFHTGDKIVDRLFAGKEDHP